MFGIALGPFHLTGRIDQGGMGQVWHAVHVRTGLPVAVKLIRQDRPELAELFFEEVRAVARLDHPHIITVLDCGRVDKAAHEGSAKRLPLGSPWMAMEYCSGGSLGSSPPADWGALRTVLGELLSALAFAHARGVLHRDLNPENVLVATATDARPGRKLTDFGLSAPRDDEPGVVVGTPAYMAPEQLRAQLGGQGPWTDLYQLGCVAWSLATGAPPFGADRPPAVLALNHLEVEPPALVPRFPVPAGFEGWLRRLLVKAPNRRPQTAADALTSLLALDGSRPPGAAIPKNWRGPETARMSATLVDAGLGLHRLRPVPLVGREVERDRLWAVLREVNRQWAPRGVILHGAAGVGKSRLARWLAERASELGAAHALLLESGPADPYLRMMARHLGESPPPPDATDGPSSHEADSTTPNDNPRLRRAVEFVERLAAERPVLLVVEDAHKNGEGVALAQSLLRADSGTPVLVLLTAQAEAQARTASHGHAFGRLAHGVDMVRIDLAPLRDAEMRALLSRGFGLGAALTHRLAYDAAGDPAYAVETLGALVDAGQLVAGPAGFESSHPDPAPPPSAVAPWLARLDEAMARLPERNTGAPQVALEIAALLGAQVDEAEWLAVCRTVNVKPPAGLLELLVRDRLAAVIDTSGESIVWAFSHSLLRAAAASVAEKKGRAPSLHGSIVGTLGRRLDPGRLARHLARAGRPGEAVEAFLAAASAAADRADWPSVVGLVEHARPLAPDNENRARLDVLRARADARGTAPIDAVRRLEGTTATARERGWGQAVAEALVARAELAEARGETLAAQTLYGESRAAWWALGDEPGSLRSLLGLARVALLLGDTASAANISEQARAIAARAGSEAAIGEALALEAEVLRRQGRFRHAEVRAREALAALGPRPAAAAALAVIAELDAAAGNLETAAAGFRRALELREEAGDASLVAIVCRLGALLASQGRLAEARTLYALGRTEAERLGAGGQLPRLHGFELALVAAAGAWTAYDQALEGARSLARLDHVDPHLADALAEAGRAAHAASEACPLPEQARMRQRGDDALALASRLRAAMR